VGVWSAVVCNDVWVFLVIAENKRKNMALISKSILGHTKCTNCASRRKYRDVSYNIQVNPHNKVMAKYGITLHYGEVIKYTSIGVY
jgi:hypothetical protein